MKRKALHIQDKRQVPTAQSSVQHPQTQLRNYGVYQSKEFVPTRREILQKIIAIRFKGSHFSFYIAQRIKEGKMSFVIVRALKHFSTDRANIQELQDSINKRNHSFFVNIKALYPSNNLTSVVYEYMPVSLAELSGDPELGQQDLAAILAQILNGLSHIHEHSLTYFEMRSCNILVDFRGVIKLWFTEFDDPTLDVIRDLKALGNITQVLMQGYENVPPRIDDITRWSEECQTFFSLIISANEISEHTFLMDFKGHDLGRLAMRALYRTSWDYGYSRNIEHNP